MRTKVKGPLWKMSTESSKDEISRKIWDQGSLTQRQTSNRGVHCTESATALIPGGGRWADRRRHLGDDEGSFSEFPRISRGLNPVGAKRLAAVSPFQGFILTLERGQNLSLPTTTIVTTWAKSSSKRTTFARFKATDICFQVEGARRLSPLLKCISSCILNYGLLGALAVVLLTSTCKAEASLLGDIWKILLAHGRREFFSGFNKVFRLLFHLKCNKIVRLASRPTFRMLCY